MQRELIYVLAGYSGDVFIPNLEKNAFIMSSRVPFAHLLHPSEVQVMNKLASLGWTFRELQQLIKRNHQDILKSAVHSESKFICSLYKHVLIFGIKKQLDEYSQELVQIEKELISEQELSNWLSLLSIRVSRFRNMFDALLRFLQETLSSDGLGCRMIIDLNQRMHSGNPIISESFNRLYNDLNQVLLNQIIAFVVDAKLSNGFFVEHDKKEFMLIENSVPNYLTNETAQKILFTGRNAAILLSMNKLNSSFQDSIRMKMSHLTESNITELIEDVYKDMCRVLWNVLCLDYSLLEHFHLFKDIYLLSDGELISVFIEKTGQLYKKSTIKMMPISSTGIC